MAITKLVITGNTTAVGISSTPITVAVVNPASTVTVNPNDNITATNVQDALEQLDDIKAQASNGTLSSATLTNPTLTGTVTSANLAVDTDTLHVDSTNHQLGVGTDSPLAKINSVADCDQYKLGTVFAGSPTFDSTEVGIALNTAFSTGGSITSNGYYDNSSTITKPDPALCHSEITFQQAPTGNMGSIVFGGSSPNSTVYNEAMRISSQGYLGIGRNPNRKLHVKESGYTDTFCIENHYENNLTRHADFGWNVADFALTLDHEDATFSVRRPAPSSAIIHTNLEVNADGTTVLQATNPSDYSLIAKNSAHIFSNSTDAILDFQTTGQGVVQILAPSADRSLILTAGDGSSDRIKLNANGKLTVPSGIRLGTDINSTSTSNILDDYEEGTWIPTLEGASSGTITGFTSSATYTKIGRLVYINVALTDISSTGASFAGALQMKGLPFTNSSTDTPLSTVQCTLFENNTDTSVSAFVNGNDDIIYFKKGSSNDSLTNTDTDEGSATIKIAGCYQTN